ncbi:uncharacterized protein PG998_013083 [Apiospora kogelbergensis]|uniref:uncharacterized protein n=1 Tax=Apiospora kogelbergensis TaxID=1337665 RepID=UPI003132912B
MGRDAPTKASRRPHRLPVNQRRHKVAPENRKRVSTACNSCNIRRIKCTGEHPCQPCHSSARDCEYPETVDKIYVPRADWDELVARCARLETCLEHAVPDATRRRDLMGRVSAGSSSSSPRDLEVSQGHALEDSSPPREEGSVPSGEKEPTCYLGPTSGAAFLAQVKDFMADAFTSGLTGDCPTDTITLLDSLGRYQAHDMPPHRSLQPAGGPQSNELKALLAELKHFTQDGHDDSSFGGIFYWGNINPSLLDFGPLDTQPDSLRNRREIAFIHAALAAACAGHPIRAEAFFERAKALMGNLLDTARSSSLDLPLLVLLAVYLIEANRADAAYMYVSSGLHIAIAHGAHQGFVDDEYEKRAFWALYALDRWLSGFLGRPPTLADEAIHLPLPVDTHGLPKPTGLVAHVKLAKIAGHIVRHACQTSSRDGSTPNDASYVETTLRMLQKWSATLPAELRLANFHLGSSRAACELRMEHNQLVILTTRPSFLEVMKKAVAARIDRRTFHRPTLAQSTTHVWPCLDAARENLKLAKWICNSKSSSRKLLAPILHHIFDAAIIVLLNGLLTEPANGEDTSDISFAIGCLDTETDSSSNYPRDCARVLRDMETLIRRMVDGGFGGVLDISATASRTDLGVPKRNTSAAQAPTTAIYDVGFILNPEIPLETPAPAPAHAAATAASHALFTEISSWMSSEEHHVYDGYPRF